MKKGDLLFVYGTLRQGESADLSKNPDAILVSEDRVNGLLYNLGWFPGMKTDPGHFDAGSPSVTGDIFRILSDDLVVSLDQYEGYPEMYDRIETETADGEHVWVYVYQFSVSEDQRVKSGDWSYFAKNTIPNPVSAG